MHKSHRLTTMTLTLVTLYSVYHNMYRSCTSCTQNHKKKRKTDSSFLNSDFEFFKALFIGKRLGEVSLVDEQGPLLIYHGTMGSCCPLCPVG